MPSLILTIARTTFLESVRQPIYFLMIALCAFFHYINTTSVGYVLSYSESGEVSNDNKLLLDLGLATVLFCGTLLAGFIATAAISREIENKTVLTIVSKPVPRVSVVLGKYLGMTGAIFVAVTTMILFFMMTMRQGAFSTAADDVDHPMVIVSLSALAIALGVAVWGNFFYGWHFVQVSTLLACPLMIVAYLILMKIGKEWKVQDFGHDFKPQITTAAVVVMLSTFVITAIAVAASTRLGQVMTIVTCFGVFVLGLLSNHLIGRWVFRNEPVGQVAFAEAERISAEPFTKSGDTWYVNLRSSPSKPIGPGDTFHYGPNPNGVALAAGPYPKWTGTITNADTYFKRETTTGLIVTAVDNRKITVRNLGFEAAQPERPPRKDDYVFTTPTTVNVPALVGWGLVPNMQFFWLSDAVSQNRPVPMSHVALVTAYTGTQVVGLLSLAVLLFQRREVG